MSIYLKCAPLDFRNPFVPLAIQATAGAVLLMLCTLFLLLVFPRILRTQRSGAFRRIAQGVGVGDLVVGCGALVVAVRLWIDAHSYIPWCFLMHSPLLPVQERTLNQDTVFTSLVVAVTVATILISFAALVVVRLLHVS